MIRITQLKLPITHTEEQLHRKIAKMLRLGNQPFTYEIRKQSLDARHKEDKKFVYTVDIKPVSYTHLTLPTICSV